MKRKWLLQWKVVWWSDADLNGNEVADATAFENEITIDWRGDRLLSVITVRAIEPRRIVRSWKEKVCSANEGRTTLRKERWRWWKCKEKTTIAATPRWINLTSNQRLTFSIAFRKRRDRNSWTTCSCRCSSDCLRTTCDCSRDLDWRYKATCRGAKSCRLGTIGIIAINSYWDCSCRGKKSFRNQQWWWS